MSNKILIVDDNSKNVQLLANLLTSADYSIEYALNGKAAVQWVEKERFDAILLDIMMPEMDGFETCLQIKKMPDMVNLPIIFLTARDDVDSINKAFKIGGVDYITKPFNQEELLARLATHVELKHNRERLMDTTRWLEQEVDKKTSELQLANSQLEQAYNELKFLDQAQNEFLKCISHEIRTPLNGISGSLSLLKHFRDNEEVNEVVSLLERSVEKLEKYSFIALQIAYLRLKGIDQLNLREININAIIKDCIGKLLPKAKQKGLEVRFKSNITGISVKGDYDLLMNAFQAIIESSITYSNHGVIEVIVEDRPDGFLCEVLDEGALYSEDKPLYMFDSLSSKGWAYERNTNIELHLAQVIFFTHGWIIQLVNMPTGIGTRTSILIKK
jgi:two-component system sensor histidine kinase/response regulator